MVPVRASRLALAVLVFVAAVLTAASARAQGGTAAAKKSSIALLSIDPLGLDVELVGRLEALFRLELERLQGAPLPARRAVDKVVASDPALRGCTGEVVAHVRGGFEVRFMTPSAEFRMAVERLPREPA